uniref:Uncharacterized protein n=1 Tax=Lepeophtheirus salmonis TaxID=72036 RepID=A0A0K2UJ70_LEPSM
MVMDVNSFSIEF